MCKEAINLEVHTLLISRYFIVSLIFDVLLQASSDVFSAGFRTVKEGVVFCYMIPSVVICQAFLSSSLLDMFVSSNQPPDHIYQLQTSFPTVSSRLLSRGTRPGHSFLTVIFITIPECHRQGRY